jgi:hypothetical protein
MEAALAPFPGLFVAGNSYRGVAMNACIEDGVRLAPRIAEYLRTVRRNREYAMAR